MKTYTTIHQQRHRTTKKTFTLIGLLAISSIASSHAAVLVTIDASNLSAVEFTATGNTALINDATSHTGEGVTFRGLFQTGITISSTAYSDTFKAASPPVPYTVFTNQEVGLNNVDLNVSNQDTAPDYFVQNFTTSGTPFTGTMTLDLTGANIVAGSSGNIIAGYGHAPSGFGSASNAVIGTWSVVPEPSSTLLLGIGSAGLLFRRRRHK